jgi:hypothetical protein
MHQVPYWAHTSLDWSVKLTAIGRYLLCVDEPTHVTCETKTYFNNIDKNIKHHRTKLATRVTTCPVIYAPLLTVYVFLSLFASLFVLYITILSAAWDRRDVGKGVEGTGPCFNEGFTPACAWIVLGKPRKPVKIIGLPSRHQWGASKCKLIMKYSVYAFQYWYLW